MLRISDESHWRVREAIQNMEYACCLEDDIYEDTDVARLEVGMTAAFTAIMVDDVIVADKMS